MRRARPAACTIPMVAVLAGVFTLASSCGTLAQERPPEKARKQAASGGVKALDGARAPSPPARVVDSGHYDEPPLDYYERQWEWFTRHVRPQRFARRDLRRRFGYDPPFVRRSTHRGYGPYGLYGNGAGPYGYDYEAEAYIQGRHDEQRFREWKQHHDKNKKAYTTAMAEGVRLHREAEYAGALRQFILAARLNQGDPASRLHAGYAMVAVGRYDEAVLIIRRAMQLQPQIPYLPLDIRAEYGPKVDFEAHLRRLERATSAAEDDPGLWMLLGFYRYFSNDVSAAGTALAKARHLAPSDPLINDLYQAAKLMTAPSNKVRPLRNPTLPKPTEPRP